MLVHRERLTFSGVLLQVVQGSLGKAHLLPRDIRNSKYLPAHLVGVLPVDLPRRAHHVKRPLLPGGVVCELPRLEEDDIAPCGFLPLILHRLVKPPVDLLRHFARAGRPRPQRIVLLDLRDRNKPIMQPQDVNIDDQALDIRKAQMFRNKAVVMERILAISQKKAEEYGVDRKTFQRIKQRIREKGDLNLNTPGIKRLLRMKREINYNL